MRPVFSEPQSRRFARSRYVFTTARALLIALLILFCPTTAAVCAAAVAGAEISDGISAAARIDELRREIARHDDLYFRLGQPEISDAAYDRLKAELRALEAAYPDADVAAPPVDELGDDRTGYFPTHDHVVPMLSLTKANREAELYAFNGRLQRVLGREGIDYWVEPKYDGIAVSLTYREGILVMAATRGNGAQGDDISANVAALGVAPVRLRTVDAFGEPIPVPTLIEIRGELLMTFAEFERLNHLRAEAGEALFANPRNLAAGTAKLRDPETAAQRRLDLVCFGWGAFKPSEMLPADLAAWHGLLRAWGLPTPAGALSAKGPEALVDAVRQIQAERVGRSYPLDGAVIKVAQTTDQEAVGWGTSAPRWALAWKFPAERAATRLLGITFQVGRTGVLTPVAELEPVRLDGSTVARASLHNVAEIARRDIRMGDTVWVEKAGDIIPAVLGPDLSQRPPASVPFIVPDACPACGHSLESAPGGAALFCGNRHCSERQARVIEHFASADALNIRGLGPRTIERLLAAGLIETAGDLFILDESALAAVPGMGLASASTLLRSIDASRSVTWEQALISLGLPGVGPQRARALASVAGDFDALLALTRERLAASVDEGGAGFGEGRAREVLAELHHPEIQALIQRLREAGVGSGLRPTTDGILSGEVIVVTGRLERWTRAEITQILEAAGAEVRDRVTGATTLLIAGDQPGSNLTRAQARNVEVIDEAALVRRLGLD